MKRQIFRSMLALALITLLAVSAALFAVCSRQSAALALLAVLCAALGVTILAHRMAGRLTRRIVAPINRMDLEGGPAAPYDELAPLARTVAAQRERLAAQMSDLRNRSDTIRAITEHMNEGMILVGPQGGILSANPAVLRMFDAPPAEGKQIVEFLRDVTFSDGVRAALSGASGEMTLTRGSAIYRIYFSHVSGGGAMILFLDITREVQAEAIRREFSANVSHELKTPLTAIYGSAELLANAMVAPHDLPVFYRRIQEEAARMIALVNDILLVSKLEDGTLTFESVDLAAVAAEAAESLSQKAAAAQVSLSLSGGASPLCASRSMMYEMFCNLMDNAIKYNHPGGCVAVELSPLDDVGGGVRVVVRDDGQGIPYEAQSRVFERFYRVDPSRSKATGGTGLGLAIVKHIVTAHGGTIDLHSVPKQGTEIAISLPCKKEDLS